MPSKRKFDFLDKISPPIAVDEIARATREALDTHHFIHILKGLLIYYKINLTQSEVQDAMEFYKDCKG